MSDDRHPEKPGPEPIAPLSWQAWRSAPHRMLFFIGASQAVLAMLWWAYDVAARFSAWVPPQVWAVPPRELHGFMMSLGLLLPFILGFLMTAGPKWVASAAPSPRIYQPVAALLAGGLVLLHLSLWLGSSTLLPGSLLWLLGVLLATLWFTRCVQGGTQKDRWHAWAMVAALWVGVLASAAWLGWSWNRLPPWRAFSLSVALWGCLTPVFAIVAHRMIPFFSGNVVPQYRIWRPYPLLAGWLVACGLHLVLVLLEAGSWLWLVDLPLGASALFATWRWRLLASFRQALLAVLHVGFAWFGVAFLLSGAGSLQAWLGAGMHQDQAALHALSIGCMASLVIGMGTRVSLGHSGRPLRLAPVEHTLFWSLQLVALARVLAQYGLATGLLYGLAALLWLLTFAAWYLRVAPIYWRARPDGKAG